VLLDQLTLAASRYRRAKPHCSALWSGTPAGPLQYALSDQALPQMLRGDRRLLLTGTRQPRVAVQLPCRRHAVSQPGASL
jgi:hypothetical protein